MTKHFDPAPDSAAIQAATHQLLATARRLSDADLAAPSLLPNWSRGHLLSHLARNADAYRRMLDGAARGETVPAYSSREERDAHIEAGAARSIADQLVDLEESATRFAAAVEAMPPGSWAAPTVWTNAGTRPASALLDGRLREVAIHHVDLDAGYTCEQWPAPLAHQILTSVAVRFDTLDMPPVTVTADDAGFTHIFGDGSGGTVEGPCYALAWWLLGRGSGAALACSQGPLPTPPAWL